MDTLVSATPKSALTLAQAAEILLRRLDSSKQELIGASDQDRIFRIEIPVAPQDILDWLTGQDSEPLLFWSDREGAFQVGGVGAADSLSLFALDYDLLFQYLCEHLSASPKNVRYYGGICFDPENIDQGWNDFGCIRFWLPRFELLQRGRQSLFACNGMIPAQEGSESVIQQIRDDLSTVNLTISVTNRRQPHFLKRFDLPEQKLWLETVGKTLSLLERGSLEKVVLARKSHLQLSEALDPFSFLKEIRENTNHCFHFCFQPQRFVSFLGASPERLYRREGRLLHSEAIAGTRAVPGNPKEKERFKKELLASGKDLREHRCVVDFLQGGLRNLCSTKKTQPISVLELKEGMHLFSALEGTLKETTTDSDILRALHPTPAVAGYPVEEANKIILKSEPFRRGWYAGAVGWVGGDAVEFAVAIRSALIRKDQISLYAGAGIVPGSSPEAEWEEVENKMNTFFKILK